MFREKDDRVIGELQTEVVVPESNIIHVITVSASVSVSKKGIKKLSLLWLV